MAGLLSWFNICCVPTVLWSLTQTPAWLRESLEARGQLVRQSLMAGISPGIGLGSHGQQEAHQNQRPQPGWPSLSCSEGLSCHKVKLANKVTVS